MAGPIYYPCRRYAGYADFSFRYKGSPSWRRGVRCRYARCRKFSSSQRYPAGWYYQSCARCWHPGYGSTMTLPDRICMMYLQRAIPLHHSILAASQVGGLARRPSIWRTSLLYFTIRQNLRQRAVALVALGRQTQTLRDCALHFQTQSVAKRWVPHCLPPTLRPLFKPTNSKRETGTAGLQPSSQAHTAPTRQQGYHRVRV